MPADDAHAPEVPGAEPSWGVVVPVKRLNVAKSRLAVVGSRARRQLALAFALDVVSTARACPAVRTVLVVTADKTVAASVAALGAQVLVDPSPAGLNTALEAGVDHLRALQPDWAVATLSSDLPCLRAGDLDAALRRAARVPRGFVADTESIGTTMLTALTGMPLDARYGRGSRAAHLASGAVELAAAAGLRRDVDTVEHLAAALSLDVGPRTRTAIAALDVPHVEAGPAGVRPDGAR